MDWKRLEHFWPRLYSPVGAPTSDSLVCFKMLLLEQWYNLSDPQCEAQCRDRLSFRRFLGLSLDDTAPDETVLVRFRQRLIKANIEGKLFTEVLGQLERAGLIVKLMPPSSRRRAIIIGPKIEHIFADWKTRRSLGRCRYVGLKKNAFHFTLLAIAHNLRRWPALAA